MPRLSRGDPKLFHSAAKHPIEVTIVFSRPTSRVTLGPPDNSVGKTDIWPGRSWIVGGSGLIPVFDLEPVNVRIFSANP
jgi:hypothetical protein